MPAEGSVDAVLKGSDRLNDIAYSFMEYTPFKIVGTKASKGLIDVSPKGGPAGFVELFDDKTLIIPFRLGNHRIDGLQNILEDPNIALLFIVPSHQDTLRIAGKAHIARDAAISKRYAIFGQQPLLALIINVEEAFIHCSRSLIRFRLWQSEHWPERKTAPTLAEWAIESLDREQTNDEVQKDRNADEGSRLYQLEGRSSLKIAQFSGSEHRSTKGLLQTPIAYSPGSPHAIIDHKIGASETAGRASVEIALRVGDL